jgi:hypothetical protein
VYVAHPSCVLLVLYCDIYVYVWHLWGHSSCLGKAAGFISKHSQGSSLVVEFEKCSLCCGNGRCKDEEKVFTQELLEADAHSTNVDADQGRTVAYVRVLAHWQPSPAIGPRVRNAELHRMTAGMHHLRAVLFSKHRCVICWQKYCTNWATSSWYLRLWRFCCKYPQVNLIGSSCSEA